MSLTYNRPKRTEGIGRYCRFLFYVRVAFEVGPEVPVDLFFGHLSPADVPYVDNVVPAELVDVDEVVAAVEDHGIVPELPVEVGPEDREDVVDRFYYAQTYIVDRDRI